MQEAASVPQYLDWSFWAVVVAAVDELIIGEKQPADILAEA
jgi:hypothetical protein